MLELEALIDLVLGEFGAHDASGQGIGAVHCRYEGVVLRICLNHCRRLGIMHHKSIFFELILSIYGIISAILVVMVTGSPVGLALLVSLAEHDSRATVLFKEAHLLFASLLLRLVLIFHLLHLFFKFFEKLLYCWLFLAS